MDEAPRDAGWLTLPNVITVVRFLLIGPVCYLILSPDPGALTVVLLAVWASTDWVDGFLARRLNQRSRVGAAIDPIADRIGISLVILAMAASGLLSWWVVGIVVVTDFLTAAFAGPAAARGELRVTYLGKFRTALLFVGLAVLILAAVWFPGWVGVGEALVWVGAALHIVVGATYVRRAWLSRSARRTVARS